ncbi:MAG: hypothetical protein ACRC3A_06700 [Culicoidibacterales bacterium]
MNKPIQIFVCGDEDELVFSGNLQEAKTFLLTKIDQILEMSEEFIITSSHEDYEFIGYQQEAMDERNTVLN